MTTREATPLLPVAADIPRSLQTRALVALFGAIGWPWLLKSLWGGRKRDKRALLARLGLPEDALPNLGSWKADTGFLTLLVDRIEVARPAEIVELGAGASSLVLARALALHGDGRLTSYDQHEPFVAGVAEWLAEHGLDADFHHAPLSEATAQGCWYRLRDLPAAIDLLVIDGPPWTVHPLGRGNAATLFARVRVGGCVMLDDAARPGERLVARTWKRDWPQFEWRFVGGVKGTLVGVRVR